MSKSNSYWIGRGTGPGPKPNTWWRGIPNSRNDDVAAKGVAPQHDAAVADQHSHGKKYPGGY